ncbi:MAG: hypothetical protein IEMM0008_1806 [bacterium]|nr:MAG: hypothetical protein IEMM0008_1806 [bacterium]
MAQYGFQVDDLIFRLESTSEQTKCLFYPSNNLKHIKSLNYNRLTSWNYLFDYFMKRIYYLNRRE